MKKIFYSQTNHVINCHCLGRINLKEVSNIIFYGKYIPKKYSAMSIKYKNPKSTNILFSTGSITNMGSKTYFGSLLALLQLKKTLNLKIIDIKLTNVVVNIYDKDISKIHFTDFYNKNKGICQYDPMIFPAITLSLPNSKIKANIFKSGKIILTGCNNTKLIEKSLKFILNKLKNY